MNDSQKQDKSLNLFMAPELAKHAYMLYEHHATWAAWWRQLLFFDSLASRQDKKAYFYYVFWLFLRGQDS